MNRSTAPYAAEQARAVHNASAVDVTEPVAGFYRFRLSGKSVRGAVKLWNGPPLDPVTGEVMDRSWRWQAAFDGEPIDFNRVWPVCAGEPISEAEYTQAVMRRVWARENAPDSAYAELGRKVDPLSRSELLPF